MVSACVHGRFIALSSDLESHRFRVRRVLQHLHEFEPQLNISELEFEIS